MELLRAEERARAGALRRRRKRKKRPASTLVAEAVEALREDILSGSLGSGGRIPLIDTSDRLAMSPIPVREALHRLAAEGLVDSLPQRGFRVRTLSLAALDDVYSLRCVIEPMAVRLAVPRLDADSLDEAQKAYELAVEAARTGPPQHRLRLHREFHFSIYRECGSPWILRIIEMLWNDSERYQRLSVGIDPARTSEHSHILDACRRKDADAAAAAIADHLIRTHDSVRRAIAEDGSGS